MHMAFPPRFGVPQFMPYGTMVPMATHYLVPTLSGPVITSSGPRKMMRREPAYEKPPVTTVFVGNIHEKGSNELIKTMLQKCGNVVQWKRIQGPNGKFQAFGFCDFDHPDSTLRAIRLLNNWPLGEKHLVVKCDAKMMKILQDFVNKRRVQTGRPELKLDAEQPPCDEIMAREDDSYRKALLQIVQDLGGQELAGACGTYVANFRHKSPTLSGKGGNLDIESLDREKKEYIAREITLFRQAHKDDKEVKQGKRSGRDRSRSPVSREGSSAPSVSTADVPPVDDNNRSRSSRKRERTPPPVDSPRSSPHSRASSPTAKRESTDRRSKVKPPKKRDSSRESDRSAAKNRRRSRSRSARRRDSEDDEDQLARKRLERKVRLKEDAYQERLKKWELREHKKTKEYEKEKEKQKEKRRDELREAKKLKEFFEDYDDERDDAKYYRGKSYEIRRRDFEREREHDSVDRKKEKEELDEIRKKLLEDGFSNPDEEIRRIQKEQEEKLLKRLKADSSESPSPVHPQKVDISSSEDSSNSSDEEVDKKSKQVDDDESDGKPWRSVEDDQQQQPKPVEAKGLGFAGLKLGGSAGNLQSSQVASNTAFAVRDEDDVQATTSKKRLVPLEYTEEESSAYIQAQQQQELQQQQNQSMSADEKRKAIKGLIEKIPTNKEELFTCSINWSLVDEALINKRLKPWVNKKIMEYIGEEEPSLVDFICQKIGQKSSPSSILDDIAMVLDEEASVFVVKLWRLLIYEIEAKRYGLVKLETPQ